MNYLKVSLLAVTIITCGTAHAQLNRCTTADGKVTYTDQPCAQGSTKNKVNIVDNTTDSSEHRRRIIADQYEIAEKTLHNHASANTQNQYATPSQNCPSELEIKNLETSASSMTLGKKEREFLHAEIRRAYACRTEGGNYSTSDWQKIKEGQAAQGRISSADRERARAMTEAIHSPRVSERELQRMQNDRRNQAIEATEKEVARRARADLARKASAPVQLVNCDRAGCWDTSGMRYTRTSGGFSRSDGAFCAGQGPHFLCR